VNDHELATSLTNVVALERAARAQMGASDLVEREAAVAVLRLAAPLTRSLESWIARRACRAAAMQSS
jgi:hypothetical protein